MPGWHRWQVRYHRLPGILGKISISFQVSRLLCCRGKLATPATVLVRDEHLANPKKVTIDL